MSIVASLESSVANILQTESRTHWSVSTMTSQNSEVLPLLSVGHRKIAQLARSRQGRSNGVGQKVLNERSEAQVLRSEHE
jgi:adenylate cyclase